MRLVEHERLTSTFFRKLNSIDLLHRFFDKFEAWEATGLDEESTPKDMHVAWSDLACENLAQIDQELKRINDIGRDRALPTLHHHARDAGIPDFEDLTPQKLAMVLYLEHPGDFDRAYAFYTIEKTERLSTLLSEPLPQFNPTKDACNEFEEEIRLLLKDAAEGPHLNLYVEGRHPDKWMATVPHQSHKKVAHEFSDSGLLESRDWRPVYEMVLIYHPAEGILRLKAGRGRSRTKEVAGAFATTMLHESADFFKECDTVSFDVLRDSGFALVPGPSDGFVKAVPTYIRFHRLSRPDSEYEVRGGDEKRGVLQALEDDGFHMLDIVVTALKIRFHFQGSKRNTRTVELRHPNHTSLDETQRDQYLEKVLTRWGFIDHDARDRLAQRAETPRPALPSDLLRV